MRPPVWFERKFDFTFPVGQHPLVYVRLRGTPGRLEEIVRGASHDVLIRRPGEKWSAQEHAGYLLDLESLWMARVDGGLEDASQLTVADLTNRGTWEARHNQRPLDEILAGFRDARSRLVSQVQNIDAATLARTLSHPRMKVPMRLVDHLFFVAEHDDHHLAHIWDLLSTSDRG